MNFGLADLAKEWTTSFTSRLKNRLLFAYALSSAVCNWPSIAMVLLSEETVAERVKWVGTHTTAHWYACFVWPVVIAISYVLLFPFVNWAVESFRLSPEKGRKSVHFQMRDHELDEEQKLADKEKVLAQTRLDSKAIETATAEVSGSVIEQMNNLVHTQSPEIIRTELKRTLDKAKLDLLSDFNKQIEESSGIDEDALLDNNPLASEELTELVVAIRASDGVVSQQESDKLLRLLPIATQDQLRSLEESIGNNPQMARSGLYQTILYSFKKTIDQH